MTSGLTVTTDYSSRLKVVPLFALLKEADLAYVSSIIKQVKYSAGEVIFREGDESKQFYIIDTGQVAVFRKDSARLEVIVRLLGPGQFFGETGLVRNEPRNATVKATADTTLFAIEKANFETLTRFRDVRKTLEATVQRRGPTLSRFDWQLPDEVAIGVSHRVVAPLILESAGTPLIWTTIAVGLFALSFIHPPSFLPWPPAMPWLLRIGGVAIFGLMLVWHTIDWTNDYLVVTNQRVVLVERYGLWREVRNEIPIDAVQNVVLWRKGVLAALLKLSDITVEAIGGKLVITHISNGQFMQGRILDQCTLARQKSRHEVRQAREELLKNLSLASLARPPAKLVKPDTQWAFYRLKSAPKPMFREWLREWLRPKIRWEKPGEITWRKHWLILVWRSIIPGFFLLMGPAATLALWLLPKWSQHMPQVNTRIVLLPLLLIVPVLAWIWWRYSLWREDKYILTTDRIVDVVRYPLGLKQIQREVSLDRIQDVSVHLPNKWAKLFDMGDVYVESDMGYIIIRAVAKPSSVQRDIYYLMSDRATEAINFDLSSYYKAYTVSTGHPYSKETTYLFDALITLCSYNKLSALPAAVDVVSILISRGILIQPLVLTALAHLGEIGAEIATYQAATSWVNRIASLDHATGALDDLDKYVVEEILPPDRGILRRIIRQWRWLVSEARGEIGRADRTRPITNPYVFANPVTGDLFVGREDILRRLEELWAKEGQCPSVVLYGHRRMGKSSILHNLGVRFGANTVIVDFNMQRVGLVANTGELLYNLALALYDNLSNAAQRGLKEPVEEHFTAHNPYTTFDHFLKQLDRARARRRFIVSIDEFELIEAKIAEHQLEPHLLDFWRGLIQTYPWFVMAFAGLHTLQEMQEDYWHPLFGSVTAIPVSFLSNNAAWQLITNPTSDFPLDYDADAVERIIALTHGQPYLLQLIGHGLVTRFNRQTFEEDIKRERRFALADVEAVIGAPEFYRDGNAYFTGVWVQAERSEPPGQTAVLRVLAPSAAGMPVEEIARNAPLPLENTQRALETLKRHDVVMQENECWKFTVELMRRWVAQSVKDDGKLDQVRI